MEHYLMNKQDKEIEAVRLRRTAEQLATWAIVHPMQNEVDTKKLLHELQVHQIELEMQNVELQRVYIDTEAALKIQIQLNECLSQSINEREVTQSNNDLAKRALLLNISNEILEPLNVITEMTKQMRQSGIDSKIVEQLERIQVACRDVMKNINSY
jgi:signal transduction histidine kinase